MEAVQFLDQRLVLVVTSEKVINLKPDRRQVSEITAREVIPAGVLFDVWRSSRSAEGFTAIQLQPLGFAGGARPATGYIQFHVHETGRLVQGRTPLELAQPLIASLQRTSQHPARQAILRGGWSHGFGTLSILERLVAMGAVSVEDVTKATVKEMLTDPDDNG